MKRFNWLDKQIKKRKISIMCQVGTGKGRTSGYILNHNPQLILHEVAYCPDDGSGQSSFFEHRRVWKRRVSPFLDRIKVHELKSEEAHRNIEDHFFDCVFIDADPSYEMCLLDIQNWYPKVKKGGLICGHDFDHPRFPGVRKAVEEFFKDSFVDASRHDWIWWAKV